VRTREAAKIANVFVGKEDHGIPTVSVALEGPGWGQCFGNVVLDDNGPLMTSFISGLCEVFGASDLRALNGEECFALYSFPYHGELIQGLESAKTGRRFILTEWRRKHYKGVLDPLQAKREALEAQIVELDRRRAETVQRLLKLEQAYIPWSSGGS